jgi:hypothetical protein
MLQGANTLNPLTCAQVPTENGAEIITTVTGTTTSFDDIFTCSDGQGTTSVLAAGSYVCAFDIINNATPPQSLGSAPSMGGKIIAGPNKVTELGTVVIQITAQ